MQRQSSGRWGPQAVPEASALDSFPFPTPARNADPCRATHLTVTAKLGAAVHTRSPADSQNQVWGVAGGGGRAGRHLVRDLQAPSRARKAGLGTAGVDKSGGQTHPGVTVRGILLGQLRLSAQACFSLSPFLSYHDHRACRFAPFPRWRGQGLILDCLLRAEKDCGGQRSDPKSTVEEALAFFPSMLLSALLLSYLVTQQTLWEADSRYHHTSADFHVLHPHRAQAGKLNPGNKVLS